MSSEKNLGLNETSLFRIEMSKKSSKHSNTRISSAKSYKFAKIAADRGVLNLSENQRIHSLEDMLSFVHRTKRDSSSIPNLETIHEEISNDDSLLESN
mmetsp:Transcript_7121/g.12790  ORF Transcript_7121/g.12790 Transcript_7121/m.12790 type:complete len:98 (-) Transcript_7121:2060-2353(-)